MGEEERLKDYIKSLSPYLYDEEHYLENDIEDVLNKLDLYKEVIEEVRALHKKFCTKHGIIVFENNELIEFMNNLIDTLNKAKENK